VIVNLSVEDDRGVAIRTVQWLISIVDVDDAQAGRSQRDLIRRESSLLIGSTVRQAGKSAVQDTNWQTPVDVGEAKNPTHISKASSSNEDNNNDQQRA
jgi:hypothetical protein